MENVEDKNFGLKSTNLDAILKILEKYQEVEKAVIFGSRAKGNYKSFSDIDLSLAGLSIDVTLQNSIENELDDLLLPYKFDVLIFHKIQNKDLVAHIE